MDQMNRVIGFRKDRFHKDTILDGEIVLDILEDGTDELKFLVFDALAVDGKILMQKNLSSRLGVVFFVVHG
jgi:mRNA guanylyltransferase